MTTNDAALRWAQPSLYSVADGVAPIHALTGERRIEGSIAIIAESLSNTDYLAVTDTTACNDDRCVTASEVVAEADGVSPFCISPLPHEPRETGNTDAELKARFQQDAIPLREPLYRYALRLTTNHYDAEDLFQDTMVKAYSAFQSFGPGTNLNGWLHRILTNTYVSTYRKSRRQPVQYSTADITDRQLAAQAAHSSTGLRSAEDEMLKELPDTEIEAAMRAIPEPIRMAGVLRRRRGFPLPGDRRDYGHVRRNRDVAAPPWTPPIADATRDIAKPAAVPTNRQRGQLDDPTPWP